ncbi:MAG: hypothetical protein V4718_04255 [Pseudomonadota bacterium]
MSAVEFTPNPGDTVFSEDGRQAEYVAFREEGHIVMPMYREDDDEFASAPWPGEPAFWHEVFAKAPIPVVDKDVEEATAELVRVNSQVAEAYAQLELMRKERAEFARDQRAIRDRLKENEGLRNIDAFLTGEITHFVRSENVPIIETADEALVRGSDRGRKEIRLLGLFGDSDKGDLRWKVCTYGDGSGGSMTEVIPCLSLEEARDRAAALLVGLTFPRLRSGALSDYHGQDAVKLAGELGVAVPEDIAAKVSARVRANAVDRLAQATRYAEDYNKQLRTAQEAARAAGVAVEGGAA